MKLLALILICLPFSAVAQSQEECRRYTQETRVGGGSQNSYGMLCKQPDGTWKDMTAASDESGYSYSAQSAAPAALPPRSHTHEFGDDFDTRVVVGDGAPYVIIDPFARYHRPNQRDWDNSKRSFYRTHNGPGWDKHWKHHQRTLDKTGRK